MAEWKKIVVSGSAISQLNNDSNYLVVTDTIDSASVAARATELSPAATASFADLASDARTADSASVAARATTLSADATASHALTAVTASHALNVPDTASFALNAQSASVAARATTLSADATASFADLASDARTADSASVAARATTLSADATASIADRATTASFADLAGALRTGTTASFADRATSASIADEASTLSATATASFADSATTASHTAGTASFADLASSARNADSSSVAARATTLSADATASFADLAGTVHDGNITNAKIALGTIANDKLVNDSVTIGSTEIDLGTTATSLTGLTSISATTGSFVLQVFESSSTIITSGSNIFGDNQNDIQQFTGSILQTGSMVVSGNLDVAVGQISGTFVGDGSGLTGLATVLTVDGDTGTQNVNLIDDDLQILGTTNEIETAVTKTGNDVRVTLGLPDSITVTASLATKADSLTSTATASFADSATTASQADNATTASHTAGTASIADTATSASIADTATSASATVAGVLFPTTDGLVNQALVTDGAGTFTYGDIFGTGSTKKLDQSVAAVTWSFTHNLNELYPIVQAYDSTGDQLIPERVESIDVNNVKLYFSTATAGVAAAMVGGMGISASNATRATSASIADEASTLSATATASIADTATSASIADEASTLSATATASFADLASDARTADSASVAARATTLSAEATASQADSATTASHALGGAGDFSGSFIGDGSGLTGVAGDFNFQGDTGATTINLLTETASFNGTTGEIETTVTANTLTIGLPNNVTIANNLTVTNDATIAGDLVVGGSIVSASSLAVEDQFIILASGSNGAIDGGIIVNQVDDHPDGKGVAFAYDSSANRWALETGLNDTASVITPDAFMGVIQESAGAPASDPVYGGTAGKGTIFIDTSADEAYIYV